MQEYPADHPNVSSKKLSGALVMFVANLVSKAASHTMNYKSEHEWLHCVTQRAERPGMDSKILS